VVPEFESGSPNSLLSGASKYDCALKTVHENKKKKKLRIVVPSQYGAIPKHGKKINTKTKL
jgi:hypothetical protein